MQSAPHSPSRAGMLNLIKKRLTKARKHELSSSTLGETDSDTEISHVKVETTDVVAVEKDTNSLRYVDTIINNSPRRLNLIEKDTNTYTKEPTNELKKNVSAKDEKADMKGNGPIVFINNTYDLPPIITTDSNNDDTRKSDDDTNHNICTTSDDDNKENTRQSKCFQANKKSDGVPKERRIGSRSSSGNRNREKISTKLVKTGNKPENLRESSSKPAKKTFQTEALKNANEVLANCKEREDSDDYYITCELPGPGAVIVKLAEPNLVEQKAVKKDTVPVEKAAYKFEMSENSASSLPTSLNTQKLRPKVAPPKRVSSLTPQSTSVGKAEPKDPETDKHKKALAHVGHLTDSTTATVKHQIGQGGISNDTQKLCDRSEKPCKPTTPVKPQLVLSSFKRASSQSNTVSESIKSSNVEVTSDGNYTKATCVQATGGVTVHSIKQPIEACHDKPQIHNFQKKEINLTMTSQAMKPENIVATVRSVDKVKLNEHNQALKCYVSQTSDNSSDFNNREKIQTTGPALPKKAENKERLEKWVPHPDIKDTSSKCNPLAEASRKNELQKGTNELSIEKADSLKTKVRTDIDKVDKGPGYSSLAEIQRYFGHVGEKKERVGDRDSRNINRDQNVKPKAGRGSSLIKCDVNMHGGSIVDSSNKTRLTVAGPVKARTTSENPNVENRKAVRSNGYTTLDDFLGYNHAVTTTSLPVEQTEAYTKQKSSQGTDKPILWDSKFERAPAVAKLELNQYKRETSHESGYETSGSKRSQSASSNEFMQHDFSSYSLLSECSDERYRAANQSPNKQATTTKTNSPMNYALIPSKGTKSDVANITSPDSLTQESTLTEASDCEDSGNDLSLVDDDHNGTTGDYLPPIPTRNYESDEKADDECSSKSSAVTISQDVVDGIHVEKLVTEDKNKEVKATDCNIVPKNSTKNSTAPPNELTVKTDDDHTVSLSKLQEIKKLLYSPIHKARSKGKNTNSSSKDNSKRSSSSSKVSSKESLETHLSVSEKSVIGKQDVQVRLNKSSEGSFKDCVTSTPKAQAADYNASPIKPLEDGGSDTCSEMYNPGSFSSDSTISLEQSFWASFEEPVHMSWDEVKNQANELGIPLTSLHNNRSPSNQSPSKNLSPSHRLPIQDASASSKFRKFGTLKEKFASLFSRRNVPGDRGTLGQQNRTLPVPPNRHPKHDDVDGSSPLKHHHTMAKKLLRKSACQVHGTSYRSPVKCGNRLSVNCKLSACGTVHKNESRMTASYHQGSTCSCACSSPGSLSDTSPMPWGNEHVSCSPPTGAAVCRCCHRVSDSAIHDSKLVDHSCLTNYQQSSPLYPKAAFTMHEPSHSSHTHCACSSRNCCQIDHSASSSRRTRSESQDHRQTRDLSHSRGPVRTTVLASAAAPMHAKSQCSAPCTCCCHGTNQSPRQTRSCSSSGIVQRCPPSPAPSSATSIMSAPSAIGQATKLHDQSSPKDCSHANDAANADFIGSLNKLKDVGWYWGPLSWEEAEARLCTKPDGSFIVRDSSDDRYILSLSFRSQGATHHTRIEHYKGMFSFYSQPKSHGASTIIEFIEKAMEHSRSGKFLYFLRPRAPGLPPAPVQMLWPISRFRTLQTLQHSCRFEILKHVRRDHIHELPVPQKIKDYLGESQYYIESLGDECLP